ncbi:MAG: DUF3617 family protein [Nitrospirae bacterium]|nr:DUF3617 family protein [Nitrospirota bacterium]
MKRMVLLILSVSLLFVSHISVAAGGPDFHEGLWEITSVSEMPGMPAMPSVKQNQCMTNKDYVPHSKEEKDSSCTVSDLKTSGNTVTWKMICKSKEGDMDGKGTITYSKDKLDGSSVINMQMPGMGKMQIKNKLTGRRIGNCK